MRAAIGALIIGDEILVGKRKDRHFDFLVAALATRGLRLAYCEYQGKANGVPSAPGRSNGRQHGDETDRRGDRTELTMHAQMAAVGKRRLHQKQHELFLINPPLSC